METAHTILQEPRVRTDTDFKAFSKAPVTGAERRIYRPVGQNSPENFQRKNQSSTSEQRQPFPGCARTTQHPYPKQQTKQNPDRPHITRLPQSGSSITFKSVKLVGENLDDSESGSYILFSQFCYEPRIWEFFSEIESKQRCNLVFLTCSPIKKINLGKIIFRKTKVPRSCPKHIFQGQ